MSGRAGHDNPACAEALRVWLEGGEDAVTEARVQAHLGRCAGCRQARAALDDTRAGMEAAAPALDDLRRARMLARLAPEVDALAADSAAGAARGRWGGRRAAIALGTTLAAAALAAGAVLLLRAPPPAPAPMVSAGAAPGPAPGGQRPAAANARAAAPARVAANAILEPYRRDPRDRTRQLAYPRVDHLEVSAGERVRARLADRARVVLLGPAELRVVSAGGDRVELALARGTLLVDYDRRRGGSLRIQAPGAVTDVVGTLFSVETDGDESRVSVARGRVNVATGEPSAPVVQVLDAGQSLSTTWTGPRALGEAARHLLDEHAAEAPAATPALHPATAPHAREAAAPPAPRPARLALAAAPPPAPAAETPAAGAPPAELPANRVIGRSAPVPATAPPPTPAPPLPVPAPPPVLAPPPALAPAPVLAPPPAPPTPEALYRDAEQAMRRRDWGTARRQLGRVIAANTGAAVEDVARYELAQMSLGAGDRAQAARLLDELLTSGREPALRAPAAFLRCEIEAQADAPGPALRCLTELRASRPPPSYDAAALGLMVRLHAAAGDCAGARPLIDEYLRRYPGGPSADEVTRRREACRR
jgi:hypothetical protein